jgi:hypothetical protein
MSVYIAQLPIWFLNDSVKYAHVNRSGKCLHNIIFCLIFLLFSLLEQYPICAFRSMWGVLDTTLCDKVCQWLATGRWFSPGTPVSSTNKIDLHDIAEMLLKAELNIILPSWCLKIIPGSGCGWMIVSFIDCHDITEILLKVALNTINQPQHALSHFVAWK